MMALTASPRNFSSKSCFFVTVKVFPLECLLTVLLEYIDFNVLKHLANSGMSFVLYTESILWPIPNQEWSKILGLFWSKA